MNIFRYELTAYRKLIIIWACSLAVLSVSYILIFSGLGNEIEAFKNVIGNLPDTVKILLGLYVDSLSTLEGFYSFVFGYIVLCGGIQAMNLGISIVSKEMRDKTADFLMTKPCSRAKVLTYKLLAVFVALLFTNVIYLVITLFATLTVESAFSVKIFLMISITLFFVQLMFASVGVMIAAVFGKIKSPISLSLCIVFGFFIVSMLGSLVGDDFVRYLTPFKYFDLGYIVKHGAYEPSYIFAGIIWVIVTVSISYLVFTKKDINLV